MAKLTVTNLKNVQSQVRKKITLALRNPDIRKGVGEIIVDQIKKEPVPVTSNATIAWRKYWEKANQTDQAYNRRNINITFTGELLMDLMKNVKAKFNRGSVSYIIEQSNKKHKKYKKPNGKPSRSAALTYKEIGAEIEKKGYEYLTFSEKSKTRVLGFIKKTLLRGIK